MTKLKKIIKNNWMYAVIYTIGFTLTIIAGWLLGRPNMLNAASFSNSSITYNENQQLTYRINTGLSNSTCYAEIHTYNSTNYSATARCTSIGNMITEVFVNGTISNNVITFSKIYYQSAAATLSTFTTRSSTFTINSDNVTIFDGYYNGTATATIVSTGYTEQEYLAYGQQQYNAGYSAGVAYVQAHPSEYNLYTSAQYSANYTAGQNSVINSPNTYGLYTQAQYEANYTSGYNAGIAYVQANPSQYNLYTASQYNSYGTSQYNAGIQYVVDHPSNYNLYTSNQYQAYGDNMYDAGVSAVTSNPNTYGLYTANQYQANYQSGVQYVIDHPSEYNLYTTAQYNAHAQEQYNAGYTAGQQASTNYQDGIQYVLDHPAEYDLYTEAQYNAYGTAQYTAGQNAVINDPNTYNLYTQVQYNANYNAGYNAGDTANANSFNFSSSTTCSDETPPLFDCIDSSQYLVYSNGILYFDNINDLAQALPAENGSSDSFYTIVTFSNQLSSSENYFIVTKESLGGVVSFYKESTDTTAFFNLDVSDYDQVCSSWVDHKCVFNLSDYISTSDYPYFSKIKVWSASYDYSVTQFGFDNSPYYNGYDNGYTVGYNNGYEIGRTENNERQYEAGYYAGINENLANTNSNTLVGLTGTILMSPVQMLKTIFNFNFLGVNLAGFILSIITIIIVAWLIKRLI